MVLETVLMMLAGYLSGAIPFSWLVARARGVDLRTVGSGNIGGANVWRSCGFGPFAVAAALDIAKGTLPLLAAIHWLALPPLAVVVVALMPLLGHSFSIFMGFKGGKAVATGGGVLIAMAPVVFLIGLAVWVLVFALGRISSVASLSAVSAVVIAATVAGAQGWMPPVYAGFIWIVGILVFYLHRENIQRLRAGTENRFQRLR